MIYIGSRYQDAPVYYMLDGRTGKTHASVIRSIDRDTANGSRVFRWVDGIRVDAIGERVYGTPDKWWILMDANPEIIDPMSIEPGTSVRLP